MTLAGTEAGDPPPLADAPARKLIEIDGLARTLFVEAGAGTGKTRSLVRRVVNLVVIEGHPLSEVAAITFTEAAAAELRDRIREDLEGLLHDGWPADHPLTGGPLTDQQRSRAEQALADADVAAISTLHAFCLRILSEHPLEVGLPPRIDMVDEVSTQLAMAERWAAFVDDLYADPSARELLLRAHALGLPVEARWARSASLKDVAGIFDANWDRLAATARDDRGPLPALDLSPVTSALADLDAVLATCRNTADRRYAHVQGLRAEAAAALDAPDDHAALACVIDAARRTFGPGNAGSVKAWPDYPALKEAIAALGAGLGACRDLAADAVLRRLAARVAADSLGAAQWRRDEGRLEFHDLLVLARQLVRTSEAARAELHRRYTRLLLDEFQDTDPIQIEVATLVAAAVAGPVEASWSAVDTEPGRLFFVGDPKQSIYRFRRADISLYLAARDRFSAGRPLQLVQNFRTVPSIVCWLNHVFARVMPEEVAGAQPRYEPLVAHRVAESEDQAVVVLGGPTIGLRAAELRDREAADVAATIAHLRDHPEAWRVFHRAADDWRNARLSDVCVLIPTRTSLRHLEDALDAVGVPYRVDTGTLVYDTQEVRDLLAALAAVDDPSDQVALVAALRSSLYACSDVDLFTWHQAGGRWDVDAPAPAGIDAAHPVAEAMAHLRTLRGVRWWVPPSALLERIVRERRAPLLALAERRPREVWRRLRFLVDQARAFEDAGAGDLRAFLAWTELQQHEGSRVHEPLLPEPDDVAVSIRTIHSAKGLEFPVTVVAGASTRVGTGNRMGVRVLFEGDRAEVRMSSAVRTEHFDRLADLEAEMDVHERQRLLYVACTRARDHLIVCTHHEEGQESFGAWLHRHGGSAPADTVRDPGPYEAEAPPEQALLPLEAEPDDRAAWAAARTALLEDQRGGRFRSATAVAEVAGAAAETPGEAVRPPGEADDAEPAATGAGWRRGRAGTAIGRAVHAVLELVPTLDDSPLVDELAAQQAHVEGVPEAAEQVARMARAGLAATVVGRARQARRLWRELPVAAPVGAGAVEGYVDLLFEEGDHLVLVDHKTDTVRSEQEVDAKVARYRLQLAAYAVAIEEVTGRTVTEAWLVFCKAGGAIERQVPDLAAAVAEVRAALAG